MHVVLKYLLQLRLVLIAAEVLGLAIVDLAFGIRLAWPVVGGVLGALAAFSLWSWRRWRGVRDVPAAEFLRQSAVDLLALSLLIYYTGGPVNPFISLFLLPIVFAAATLPLRTTSVVALMAGGSYTALMFFYQPLSNHQQHMHGMGLHLWGMWYGFLISAGCVALFVARIARSLRQRDQDLAAAREQALEAERAIALGTLAAGTAHELGTPLATIAILAKDLETDLRGQAAQHAAMVTLRAQVARCKESLARLAADAGALPADSGHSLDAERFLRSLLDEWQRSRLPVTLDTRFEGSGPSPQIVADRTLRQALFNVLNNAADASSARVEVSAGWTPELLWLRVRDDGPGVAETVRERIGREVVSTKGERGMGLGLYLAQSVLRRLGGTVEFLRPGGGGTLVNIEIPLLALRAEEA